MPRQLALVLSGCLGCLGALSPTLHAQEIPASTQTAAVVRDVRVTGTYELALAAVRAAMQVTVGDALAGTPDQVAERVEKLYRQEGYSFAHATARFDAGTGTLAVAVDEGVIDEVEFEGIDADIAAMFAEEFAMRAGDVFNADRAGEALDILLRRTRGAVRPGRITNRLLPRSEGGPRPPDAFDLIERNGRRVLRIGLEEPPGRVRFTPEFGGREDWFTPVDGFVPSLAFGSAFFDHRRFNHTYVAAHLSLHMASGRAGYALGFERPLFGERKLYLGAELHDLTATDDQWQVSTNEAGLAALWSRRSYRDYYRRRGVQGSAALRVHPQVELLAAVRSERHEPLGIESDFSLWRRDQPFRANFLPQAGTLNALVIGASIDGRSFERESLETTYRRHQLDRLLGERLEGPRSDRDGREARVPDGLVWRIDWLSELSAPGALASDFDFSRHVVSARARQQVTRHQSVGARLMGGWSGGTLPPQRAFGLGGIGSVHGYQFKEAVGGSLALVNLEYAYDWRNGIRLFGLFDAGRVGSASAAPSSAWLNGVGMGVGLGDVRIDFGYKLNADFVNGLVYGDDTPSRLQVLIRFGRTF
jgi:hypothetical protein